MADQFHSGNWWASARPPAVPPAGGFDGVSCSATELACTYSWAAENMFQAAKSRSCDESPVSISSGSVSFFQDHLHHHDSHAPVIAGLVQLDAAQPAAAVEFGLLSPSVEWSGAALFGRSESGGSVHGFLQEDAMSRAYAHRDSGTIESDQIYSRSSFLQDHIDAFPLLPSSGGSLGLPYTALSGLLEHDSGRLPTSYDDAQAMNYKYKPPIESPPQEPKQQFSNEIPFWNPTAPPSAHQNLHQERLPQPPVQKQSSSYRNFNSNIKNSNSSGAGGSSSMEKRNGSCEPSLKKPRMETPTPLPTFKVRKEKLGDRITALQQLVAPFGKTDTASVLHEATEYIKFLHDQVRVLSAPYLKNNGHQTQPVKSLSAQPKGNTEELQQHQDLRSRGLCLVPISSTFAVANEMHPDFWSPPFMGTFR